jgi:hypothetical protein
MAFSQIDETAAGLELAGPLGLFGATPVAQPNTGGTVSGFTAGAGTAVLDDSTFTGDLGDAAYTVGDIVLALKQLGALATGEIA